MDIVNRRSGELIVPSEKIDERGFFVAVLPDDAPDYALRIRYTEDTEPVIEEDPYHFSSALQDMDSWLLAEGKHLRPYETLGAHFAELDGVKGVRFAVWRQCATRFRYRRVQQLGRPPPCDAFSPRQRHLGHLYSCRQTQCPLQI